ncbi:RES domain-containing protein [Micrococcus luteus]|uniref:RES domain-containing protein n=1 Tax=Micrococcus luteus TaxID=1270 RepID=UPI0015D6C98F|nr:RES domain-containing protein [Micrococcus luteus]
MGYPPDPWQWADWKWAAPEGRFQGRWDALDGGLYRTLYVGGSLFACLVELLAPLRPDPVLAERLGEITVEPEDAAQAPTEEPGVIDVDDWTARRRAGSAHLTGRFCVVTAFETIAALRPRFAGIATGVHGLADFDAAALKDARPRLLTQAVSQHLWEMRQKDGADLCDGVEFLSRHGDDLPLWAVFERPGDGEISPHLTDTAEHALTRDTPDLVRAFELHGLRMRPRP